MTDFELNTHARLAALEYLLQNLYYMQYRSIGATTNDIGAHHRVLLDTVKSNLQKGFGEFSSLMDQERATAIVAAVERHLEKNLSAVRGMWETTPRSQA
jgi:hypothetical protein